MIEDMKTTITRIRSGGQSGVDRVELDIASIIWRSADGAPKADGWKTILRRPVTCHAHRAKIDIRYMVMIIPK